jgi:CubicO group peptidase (beta-lactamase class C family)
VADIKGTFDERFVGVRDALSASIDSGADVGASAAVTVDGELVVDIWGGTVDEAGTTPWERDTIINVWSTTKTMSFVCALLLADRGELDFNAPVATYWPEFAAEGKGDIEVRHLMSHSAGLSGWSHPMAPEDLYDWDLATSRLAAQAPLWEPGTASGYHAITQGYLIGEVVRRITGDSIGTFFAKEVAGPLDADFHIGTGPEHDDRVALVIPNPPLEVPDGAPDLIRFTFANPPLNAKQSWEIPWRRAEIPAAGGHGNARSVAKVQSVIACGGEVGGTRLLSEAGCRRIFEEQTNGTDLILGVPIRFGMGYGLPSDLLPLGPSANTCFWGGWGGSLVLVDLDQRVVISYVMNRMGEGTLGDDRGLGIAMAAFGALSS